MEKLLKLTFILFSLAINHSNTSAQHKKSSLIEKQLFEIADTFGTNYSGYIISLTYGESLKYIVDKKIKFFIVTIPDIKNLNATIDLAQSSNKIGSTKNYLNKTLAHQVNLFLASELIKYQDTLILHGKDLIAIDNLISQIVLSDISNCCKFTDTNIFNKLKKHNFTPDIIKVMRELFANPFGTEEEARIILSSKKPYFNTLDTGYNVLYKKDKDINMEYDIYSEEYDKYQDKAKAANMTIEEWLNINDTTGFLKKYYDCQNRKSQIRNDLSEIISWRRMAEKTKMPLKDFLDSMQIIEDNQYIKFHTNKTIGIWPIADAVGQNYLNELAPEMEQLLLDGKIENNDKKAIKLNLARMQYKDYEKTEIRQTEDAIKTTDSTNFNRLRQYLIKLIYINTQESFYATAPLLLYKSFWGNELNNASIGARVFIELRDYITNFPFDEKKLIDKISEGGKYDVLINEIVIDNELGEIFLKEMYQWMIENKGNYKIVQNRYN
jgi:hypothetical protein